MAPPVLMEWFNQYGIGISILIIALTFHEFGHAAAAYYLGDDTAQKMGRMTLNPLKHLDPWGTLCFVFLHFGWGKPVPVSLNRLKNPRTDHALIAAAGPLMNGFQVVIFALAFHHPGLQSELPLRICYEGTLINLLLMVFNLLPFPPLDGGAIISLAFRDFGQAMKFQRTVPLYFMVIIAADMLLGLGLIRKVLFPPIFAIMNLLGLPTP